MQSWIITISYCGGEWNHWQGWFSPWWWNGFWSRIRTFHQVQCSYWNCKKRLQCISHLVCFITFPTNFTLNLLFCLIIFWICGFVVLRCSQLYLYVFITPKCLVSQNWERWCVKSLLFTHNESNDQNNYCCGNWTQIFKEWKYNDSWWSIWVWHVNHSQSPFEQFWTDWCISAIWMEA